MSLELSIAGTIVIWAISAGLAVLMALVLTAGSLSRRRLVHLATRVCVHCIRGIPTSILVLAAGVGILSLGREGSAPAVFPATPPGYELLAWGIVLALALGSAGHLAEIFRSAHLTLGQARLDEVQILGLRSLRRAVLLVQEAVLTALPPTGARLVHHLHNTAFTALFPVTELFGYVQSRANESFEVVHYVVIGACVYVALSALIWTQTRVLEAWISRRVLRTGGASRQTVAEMPS